MRSRIPVCIALAASAAAACKSDRTQHASDTARVTTSNGAVTSSRHDTTGYPVIRALYLNRFAAQSGKKMRHLFAIADSTEINGFVIDMKDEFGLNFRSSNPAIAKNAGGDRGYVTNVRALVDSVKAHGLVPIARIVAFKDPVAANKNPEWTIRREDSTAWQDKEGLIWVNAFDKNVWEYNIAIAEELVKLGFEEIQWDYIRFPEPYQSLPKQVFPGATTSKADALAGFLKLARERLNKLGARSTADIFGLVASVKGTLEVGQNWEKISPNVDVVLPMVYPSHYPHGSFGLDHPNAEPYKVIRTALDTAKARDGRMKILDAEHVRPWLQAFTLGAPKYGPEQIEAQKKAAYDAGYQGWVLWSPGSYYDAFVPALGKAKAGMGNP
jgi:hypothetical protein